MRSCIPATMQCRTIIWCSVAVSGETWVQGTIYALGASRVRSPDPFLESTALLVATDAVAGLLTLEDGRYVMQLRDLKPDIFYPGHWGLFGGAIDPGESERDALCRELQEELAFRPR